MKTLFFILLFPCIAFSQSSQIKYLELEHSMYLDNLKFEDFLFLKGYRPIGDRQHILLEKGIETIFSKGKTITDYSSITRTRYQKFIYAIQFQTYSLVQFDNMRKSLINLGYKRLPDEGTIICYESNKLSIGLSTFKDEDGDTKYSVYISDRSVNPYDDLIIPKSKEN